MGFTVGEKSYFIGVLYTKDPDPTSRNTGGYFQPWKDKLVSIDLFEMTCVESMKVPGEWDDTPRYTGYKFIDASDRPWYCQYPRYIDPRGSYSFHENVLIHTNRPHTGYGHSHLVELKAFLNNLYQALESWGENVGQSERKAEVYQSYVNLYGELIAAIRTRLFIDVVRTPATYQRYGQTTNIRGLHDFEFVHIPRPPAPPPKPKRTRKPRKAPAE